MGGAASKTSASAMQEDPVTPIDTAVEADATTSVDEAQALKLLRPEPVAEVEDAFDLFSVLSGEEPDLGPVQPETPRAPEAVFEPEPPSEPVPVAAPAGAPVVRAQTTVEIVAGTRRRGLFRR
jgi:hypothetical protein